MRLQDYLVGGIAMALGAAAVWHAALAGERLMHLAKFRVLVDAIGPGWARWFVGGLGLALVTGGALIASGFRFPWQ